MNTTQVSRFRRGLRIARIGMIAALAAGGLLVAPAAHSTGPVTC